ncbi:hypothetical protein FQN54_000525 [Arachnomyces sp. PD_36]|nr:hypothetical protein FQN54_000525 [Arachnomyces sp. PD_36]
MIKPQAASTPLKSLSSHLRRLQSRWPSDPVRPASVSIPTYLQNHNPSSTPSTSTPESPAKPPPTTSSINALYSLVENRYANAYPLPQHLRYPASNPSHYDDLVREFAEAPTRGWFASMKKKLGGFLRMK